MEITAYFRDVVKQDAQKLKNYFAKDAKILWHNTNECFTAEEFIRANCEYPGSWDGEIEILTPMQDGWILAARVWEKDLAQNGEEARSTPVRAGQRFPEPLAPLSLVEYVAVWALKLPVPHTDVLKTHELQSFSFKLLELRRN